MKLTEQILLTILMSATEAAFGEFIDAQYESRKFEQSIKLGEEAVNHTGSSGTVAYFCTEESMISSAKYDAPNQYWAWEESVTEQLRPYGLFVEPINGVEYGIYSA